MSAAHVSETRAQSWLDVIFSTRDVDTFEQTRSMSMSDEQFGIPYMYFDKTLLSNKDVDPLRAMMVVGFMTWSVYKGCI